MLHQVLCRAVQLFSDFPPVDCPNWRLYSSPVREPGLASKGTLLLLVARSLSKSCSVHTLLRFGELPVENIQPSHLLNTSSNSSLSKISTPLSSSMLESLSVSRSPTIATPTTSSTSLNSLIFAFFVYWASVSTARKLIDALIGEEL